MKDKNIPTYSKNEAFHKEFLLGVGVTDASAGDVLEYLLDFVQKGNGKIDIVTPNPEILVIAQGNPVFKKALNDSQIALLDSAFLKLAYRLEGKPLKERIPGTDFVEMLCRTVAKRPITVGFLGGRGNVAERTADCLQRKYPGLKVAFAAPYSEGSQPLIPKPVDILFVALGAPKQELFISKNLNNLPVKVAMGVGGAFDYLSGDVKRAPKLVRNMGFEWLFRLIRQPWRIKRQTRLIKFVLLVLREKLTQRPF